MGNTLLNLACVKCVYASIVFERYLAGYRTLHWKKWFFPHNFRCVAEACSGLLHLSSLACPPCLLPLSNGTAHTYAEE